MPRTASTEREVKLIAPGDFQVPSVDEAFDGLSAGQPHHLDLTATYFDTADLALIRSGITVRYRSGESGPPWTVKIPRRTNGSALTRRELRFDGSPDLVPDAASDLVRAHVRTQQLQPVARLHTRRIAVPLLDQDGSPVAELVDDLVTSDDGQTHTVAFREVELELAEHASHPDHLQRAATAWLIAAGCRPETPQPKLARVLGPPATTPPEVLIAPLGAEPTVIDLVQHAISASTDLLINHDAGLRLGEDPEEVHQFRVAARTLRSNLKTFAPLLAHGWAQQLRVDLGWIAAAAGAVRDLDVLDQRLRNRIADLPPDDSTGAATLLERVEAQRDTARAHMLSALRSDRYVHLLDALAFAARTPLLDADARIDQPACAFVRHAVRIQARHLDRAIAALTDPPSDSELHRIRIQAKRTRYAIEAARPITGHPAAAHAAALARLQDILGDLHDSAVTVQWLRDAAAVQPASALAAGQLIASETAEQRRLHRHVDRAVHDATTKKLRRWV